MNKFTYILYAIMNIYDDVMEARARKKRDAHVEDIKNLYKQDPVDAFNSHFSDGVRSQEPSKRVRSSEEVLDS